MNKMMYNYYEIDFTDDEYVYTLYIKSKKKLQKIKRKIGNYEDFIYKFGNTEFILELKEEEIRINTNESKEQFMIGR